jgi:hypothetical protein
MRFGAKLKDKYVKGEADLRAEPGVPSTRDFRVMGWEPVVTSAFVLCPRLTLLSDLERSDKKKAQPPLRSCALLSAGHV